MENLRWILIFAGVAILVLLYFSGRPGSSRKSASDRRLRSQGSSRAAGQSPDPLLGEDGFDDGFDTFADPRTGEQRHDALAGFDDADPEDMVRPAGLAGDGSRPTGHDLDMDPRADQGRAGAGFGLSSFSQKIEAFSERLSPKRRQRVAASEPADTEEVSSEVYASKIITLHVVAPPNGVMAAEHLLQVFEQRGYHFGEMNIFHSMHNGKTVFSVAKMVEPGFFDIDSIDSFETPGITLILQLPGPVPADVAFEVLVSEAFEMAAELGATVLDGDRSTLTKQTVQHLREGIYEYMHRQKYFGSVPS